MRVYCYLILITFMSCGIGEKLDKPTTSDLLAGEFAAQPKQLNISTDLRSKLKMVRTIEFTSPDRALFHLNNGESYSVTSAKDEKMNTLLGAQSPVGDLYRQGDSIWRVGKSSLSFYKVSENITNIEDGLEFTIENFTSYARGGKGFFIGSVFVIVDEEKVYEFTLDENQEVSIKQLRNATAIRADDIVQILKLEEGKYEFYTSSKVQVAEFSDSAARITESRPWSTPLPEIRRISMNADFTTNEPLAFITADDAVYFMNSAIPKTEKATPPPKPSRPDNTNQGTTDEIEPGDATPAIAMTEYSIGEPTLAGNVSESGGAVIVQGAGTDIWSNADQFQFYAAKTMADSFDVRVKVTQSNATPHDYAKYGLMVRNGLAADAAHVLMALTGKNHSHFQYRAVDGGVVNPNPTNLDVGSNGEMYLRLVRNGSVLTGYYSLDNEVWTELANVSMTLGEEYYIGLAVTSHIATALNSATFDVNSMLANFPQ